jgi:NTP pyrophosphatase (non-canonical NTP hydrolase)
MAATLADNSTLLDIQKLVAELSIARGFDEEMVPEVLTLLVEEIGELAKAIRKSNGQKIDVASEQFEVAEEAADVLWLLLDICNRLQIDLTEAFQQKELKNQKREWK